MTHERRIDIETANWRLCAQAGQRFLRTEECADQLAALAWLHSGGTVAGLDAAERRILAVLDELEAAA